MEFANNLIEDKINEDKLIDEDKINEELNKDDISLLRENNINIFRYKFTEEFNCKPGCPY